MPRHIDRALKVRIAVVRTEDTPDQKFPVELWRLTETALDTESNLLHETLFTVGNGYIGLRGAHEDGYGGPPSTSIDGSYLNGFYESEPIHYPETAYGLARHNQFMLNVPNAKLIDLIIDNEPLDLLQGTLLHYQRSLDFSTGILSRSVDWISPTGRQVAISSRRLACFQHKHLYAIEYQVTAVNFTGRLTLISALDGLVQNQSGGDDPRAGSSVSGPVLRLLDTELTDDFSALVHGAPNSGLSLVSATAVSLALDPDSSCTRSTVRRDQRLEQRFDVELRQGQQVCLTKYGSYFSSRDYPAAELMARTKATLETAAAAGFASLCSGQQDYLHEFWQAADVEIAGDDALQQAVRFNQFHLLQSVGRDGKTNIAAKGITGEGYEGHYFWDSEIYVFPFFLYTRPDIARKLLQYRYQGLDQARQRAREMSHLKGALYPWRTIGGEECSAYFPAGTAQYHFNADIAYSIKQYAEATGDLSFLFPFGAEIVLETARIWIGIGNYSGDQNDRFTINDVTGPDEYTAIVNNNYYTNAMAKLHLEYAAELAETFRATQPHEFTKLSQTIELEPDEPAAWRRAAEHMYLPYDAKLGVHPQDDSFLSKKVWDFAATPRQNYPLLLHYHPLVIYRHQVCKQADMVLALLLLGNRFTPEEKRRDFAYYEPLTTHDSSLSMCIFSIIACEIGFYDKAYAYFMKTARVDLDNTHGNSAYGVHTASMAGTWLCVVYGFAGMRAYQGKLQFSPFLPDQWDNYQFSICFKGLSLHVRVSKSATEYTLVAGDRLDLTDRGRVIRLTADMPTQAVNTNHAADRATPTLDAVIFDLDGVITDTAHYHFRAWQRLAERERIPFDEAFNERLKGVDRMGSLELILSRSSRLYSADEKLALAELKNRHYQELIATMSSHDLLPGALDALNAVRQAGLKVGLASVSKNAPFVLDKLEITDRFDVIVDARSIAKSKPDPEIFLTAADLLNVDPARCIGVEDAVAGIQAIKRAGMYAVGVGERSVLAEADYVIPGLAAFRLSDYVR
jgi:beta-phosphoglucomutase